MTFAVVDNWMSPGLLRAVAATWPDRSSAHWHSYHDRNSIKLASRSWAGMPIAAQCALAEMAKVDIYALLGIADTFPDLEGLNGAGLHHMETGGQLGLHLDAERHPLQTWKRVASAVLYLDDCDGGNLELCDANGIATEIIRPAFNRLAVFTCDQQWHRVTECKSRRRSLCLFWWATAGDEHGATRATFR